MKPHASRRCRYCLAPIPSLAKVCQHCHRHQNWLFNHFRVDHVGLLIALLIVLLSYLQFYEARRERLKADEALMYATRAKDSADQLTKLVNQAQQSIQQVDGIVEFMWLLVRASNDERPAYDQLCKMRSIKGPFQNLTMRATEEIALKYIMGSIVYPKVDWLKCGIDPSVANLKELKSVYWVLARAFKPDYLNTVLIQDRFPKGERLQFLYEVIRDETSLHALQRGCRLIDQEAKLGKNFLGASIYMEWWEKNSELYETDSQSENDSIDKGKAHSE